MTRCHARSTTRLRPPKCWPSQRMPRKASIRPRSAFAPTDLFRCGAKPTNSSRRYAVCSRRPTLRNVRPAQSRSRPAASTRNVNARQQAAAWRSRTGRTAPSSWAHQRTPAPTARIESVGRHRRTVSAPFFARFQTEPRHAAASLHFEPPHFQGEPIDERLRSAALGDRTRCRFFRSESLTRVFSRATGETPASFRRVRRR